MIIIKGRNRVEFCKIKPRDQSKRLFATRNQLYRVSPCALIRMRQYDKDGKEDDSEEVQIFEEEASAPFDTPEGVSYYQEDVLPEIDMIRSTSRTILGTKTALMRVMSAGREMMLAYGGMIITGIVLAWAFLSGGV